MTCQEAQSLRDAYLDGELQAPVSLQFEEHVRACPACSQMLAEHQKLQTFMKSDALYHKAPEILRARLQAALRSQRGECWRRSPWRWLAVAACLVFCVGVGFGLAQLGLAPSQHEHRAQEVVSAHIRSLQVGKSRLVDVRSTDRHEVKPWFSDKLDFSPPVPDLTGKGFALVGGRLDYVADRPIAVIVYQRRQHLISVLIWPAPAAKERRHEARHGFQLISWSSAGMSYWVVSDLNRDELDVFAQELK